MTRLLFVEDDEALSLGIEFTLQEEGYEVLRAASLEAGKNIFENENWLAYLEHNKQHAD